MSVSVKIGWKRACLTGRVRMNTLQGSNCIQVRIQRESAIGTFRLVTPAVLATEDMECETKNEIENMVRPCHRNGAIS